MAEMTPIFYITAVLTVIGMLIGAGFGYPVFGAFCGFCVALGVLWNLGEDE